MNRAAVSRADLIRWAATLDDGRLVRLAESLGYQEEEAKPDASFGTVIEVRTATVKIAGYPAQVMASRHREYHLLERRALAPLPELEPAKPIKPSSPEPPVEPLGPPPPLVPWRRLWPFLHAALGELAERNRVDLQRLVAACSRGEPPRRLPRIKGQRWASRGQLILDLSPRLYPFWDDFNALKFGLPRLRGATGLDILRMDDGPDGPVQTWDGGAWGPPASYAPPAADVPILIAGDLGCLGTSAHRQAWVHLGRRLGDAGRRPSVLTPCPPRWWHPDLAGLYFPVFLDRAAHIPPRAAGPRPWPERAPELAGEIGRDAGAELLLTLLSASVAIRPALLRHLRHRLPAELADTGSEAAAWQHSAFVAGDFALLPGEPEAIGRLRQAFSNTGDEDQRRLAWDLIRAQQEDGAPRSQRVEERVLYAAIHGRTDPEAEAFLEQVGDVLTEAREANDPEYARFLTGWINRRADRMHPDAWRHSPSSEALWLKANPKAVEEGAVLPAGYDLHRALRAQARPAQPQLWRLVQRGDWLEVEHRPAPERLLASGSPVVDSFFTTQPIVQVKQNGRGSAELSLPLEESAALPLGEDGLTVRTQTEELVIRPMDRAVWASWAHTLGRDGNGLFVRLDDGWGDRRAYWYAQGPGILEAGTAGIVSPLQLGNDRGFFLDEDQLRALTAPLMGRSAFPQHIMEDQYGVFADIDLHGLPLRFRWIWPGRFLMGSPKIEEGRFDDESQHQVILSRGFWLAETACTQALWETVMGKNPSYATEAERPVENVSWDDVQGFLERLHAELAVVQSADASPFADLAGRPADSGLPGSAAQTPQPYALRFRLPTEAEWEYACRAGTASAYSFGDTFDAERANSGRTTVKVRSLPPNPWGLYEMHGNVWEWCQDWYGDYPEGPLVDPVGSPTGGGRVLRGGGWFFEARHLRSACRGRDVPGARDGFTGFRLALGPELSRAGSSKSPGSETGQSAQGASGSERKARAVGSRGAAGKRTP
jgi:hypothetical protein